ncbi:uncharacterized protein [Watersipora subatra]|uniref:uncharacterized protein n=1 Tax=Watersipora subatra TaxID=2589382 RepID=UPI00355C825A
MIEEDAAKSEIHCFSDASTTGYGACAYLRQITKEGEVKCSYLLGKARVAPLKMITIPHMELQAAVVATQLVSVLERELKDFLLANTATHYWCDSMIVLNYISNDAKKFKVYVANRIQQTRDVSTPTQWHHIASRNNPADHASRGSEVKDIIRHWINPPNFLQQSDIKIPTTKLEKTTDKLPEARCLSTSVKEIPGLLGMMERYSKWETLINIFAVFIRLDPYTDDDGIVRIRERLKYCTTFTIDLKHPAILPKTCNITNLIVQYYHRLTGHSGRGLTTATIRQNGYWITGLSTAVSTVINNCVICKKLRGNTETQKMADLPAVRLEPATPFHYSGMDCFGPFHAKDGRCEVKRYGLMFTCLTSRAVHIEMLDDLTTDAFLNSLRCLIAMRGSVKSLYSDQGTNFRGAQTELKKNLAEINEELHKNLQKSLNVNFFLTPHRRATWEAFGKDRLEQRDRLWKD